MRVIPFALILALTAIACEARETIALLPGQDVSEPTRRVMYYLDESHRLQLDDFLALPGDRLSRVETSEIINLGLRGPVIWLRLDLRNAGPAPGHWILGLNRALLDEIDIWVLRQTGVDHPLNGKNRETILDSYRRFETLAADIELAPGEHATAIVRYLPPNWSGMPLTLQSADSFRKSHRLTQIVYFGILVGVLAAIFYTVMPFLMLGREVFAVYAAAQVSLFLLYTHLEGMTTIYLFPEHPEFGKDMAPVFGMTFNALILQFARVFFDTRSRLPRADRVLRVLVWLMFIACAMIVVTSFAPSLDRRAISIFAFSIPILNWFILPALAIYGTLYWTRDAWPLVISWTGMALFTIGAQFVWFGMLPQLPFGTHIYGVVVAIEAIALSTAIMLRVRAIQQARIQTEQALSQSLERELAASTEKLEAIQDREIALQESIDKGRMLLATGHDARQLVSALRNYAGGLALRGEGADVQPDANALADIAGQLDAILTTAIDEAYDGSDSSGLVAIGSFRASRLFQTLDAIYQPGARAKGLELRFYGRHTELATDRALLTRIAGNLLSNAIKYTATGRVVCALRRQGRRIRLQVFDTGAGIAEPHLAALLDPQHDAHRFDEQVAGEGAGLAICHRLASRIGASLSARSWPGRGTVFELILPSCPVELTSCLSLVGLKAPAGTRAVELPPDQLDSAPGLIIIDQDHQSVDGGLTLAQELLTSSVGPGRIAIATHDRTVEYRRKAGKVVSFLIYKPIDANSLAALASRFCATSTKGMPGEAPERSHLTLRPAS